MMEARRMSGVALPENEMVCWWWRAVVGVYEMGTGRVDAWSILVAFLSLSVHSLEEQTRHTPCQRGFKCVGREREREREMPTVLE